MKKYTLVGEDEYGNKYYLSPKNKRICIYKSIPEVSKIPPEWYNWMYSISDEINTNQRKYSWQKNHKPNTTGTKFAYKQKKSLENIINSGLKIISKKYIPWNPK